jgi:5-methyltetrahydrofolate--homocysteine methyltransferase
MAEALAEYVHKRIRGELGFAAEEARDPDAMLSQGYRGTLFVRLPRLPQPRRPKAVMLLALPRADEIGITLSEEDQLDPEQSTSAIVLHHPQAKYFSV